MSAMLGFEETLRVLQGLLNRPVASMISGAETEWLPIAYFRGSLTRATSTPVGPKEAVMFRFDDGTGREETGFFLLSERFRSAHFDAETETLTIHTEDGVIRVFPDNG